MISFVRAYHPSSMHVYLHFMQVKAEEVVKDLQSSNVEERRKAARYIKNAIIGNKIKKRLYANLGVIAKYE